MTTTITSHLMTSTVTEHYAHRVLDPLPTEAPWRASWLPGRRLDYCQATTAMVVAETVALHHLPPGSLGPLGDRRKVKLLRPAMLAEQA